MNANTQQAAAPIDDKPEIKHEEAVDVLAQGEPAGRADYSGFITKTDPVEIRLVRKLDYRIMPCLVAMYFISFLDRNAITLAKLSSIEKDLRLTDVQYQTCVSIFFVGYCITSVPSNMILTRVRPSYFLCGSMLVWTAVSIATAFAHNFGGLMATRIVLGVVEAPFYPGALLIISNFYTRTEVATRIAILYTGGIMATAFAGLIAAGIYQLDGRLGLAGWQWLHIIIGICTGIITLICFPICPDTPLTTRWLSEDERALAHGRLQRDKVDQEAPGSTMAGLRQAVSDYRVWLFCACQFCHQGANGFKTFFPSVVGTLGFSTVTTLCLTCPPYIIAAIVTIVLSLSSGKFNERTWHITASKLVATFGFVLAAATLNTAARYVAMCIFTLGTYGVNSLILGWASTVCSQSQEKKAVTIAMMITCGNAAFIATPYLFIQTDRPRYTIAMSSMGAFSVATFLIAWAMKFILIRQNKTLARSGAPTKYPY